MQQVQVELSLTLHQKVNNWNKEDQIYFSAFVQCLREMSLDVIFGSSNCIPEDANVTSAGVVEALSFWMKIRGDYCRFVIREPVDGVLILSDR